ncbi:MAG: MFS transporter [Burkholderiales bacterium]|nr:MFS transporter [Burkholderiales bacterium]
MQKKNISSFVVALGTALEWYDFTLYILFAAELHNHFFPVQKSLIISNIETLAFGYLIILFRPIGAYFFSQFVYKYSYKFVFKYSILMICLISFIIATLPSFNQIGVISVFILITCRLLQSIVASGQYIIALNYNIEDNSHFNGFKTSLTMANSGVGILIATIVANYSNHINSTNHYKFPFLIGSVIGLIFFYLNQKFVIHLNKENLQATSRNIFFKQAVANYKKILYIIGLNIVSGFMYYYAMFAVFEKYTGISQYTSDLLKTLTVLTTVIFYPFSAYFIDKYKGLFKCAYIGIGFFILIYSVITFVSLNIYLLSLCVCLLILAHSLTNPYILVTSFTLLNNTPNALALSSIAYASGVSLSVLLIILSSVIPNILFFTLQIIIFILVLWLRRFIISAKTLKKN